MGTRQPTAESSTTPQGLEGQLPLVASMIRHGMAGDIESLRRCAVELHNLLKASGDAQQAKLIEQAINGRAVPLNGRMPELPGFPKEPPYSGCWRPVYWTPIIGSSERLMTWVLARGDDGQARLLRTIRKEVLAVAFDEKTVEALLLKFTIVENELNRWLANADPYNDEDQLPPLMTGFHFGEWRATLANDVNQLAAYGVRLGAAFANPELADLNNT